MFLFPLCKSLFFYIAEAFLGKSVVVKCRHSILAEIINTVSILWFMKSFFFIIFPFFSISFLWSCCGSVPPPFLLCFKKLRLKKILKIHAKNFLWYSLHTWSIIFLCYKTHKQKWFFVFESFSQPVPSSFTISFNSLLFYGVANT